LKKPKLPPEDAKSAREHPFFRSFAPFAHLGGEFCCRLPEAEFFGLDSEAF
jgi:hypothetical protein